MKHTSPIHVVLLVTMVLGAWGCGQPGSGRFVVEDIQKHSECMGKIFPFEPIFFAARERTDSMGLFFQSRGGNFQGVDLIHLEIFDTENIVPGDELSVEAIASTESEAVGGLEPGESCPDLRDSLAVTGTLVFDSFSRDVDGLIEGEINGQVVSVTDESVVASGLNGMFSFTVQLGQPYEEFRK